MGRTRLRREFPGSVSNSEVVTARGGRADLDTRLDEMEAAPQTARISAAISASDTSFTVQTSLESVAAGMYVVVGPGDDECEVFHINSVSGSTVNLVSGDSFANAHAADDLVLFLPEARFPVTFWGAYPKATEAAAADITSNIQAAIDAVPAYSTIVFPKGFYGIKGSLAGGAYDGIVLDTDNIHIEGVPFGSYLVATDGVTATRLLTNDSGNAGTLLENVSIYGMGFIGADVLDFSNKGIDFYYCKNIVVERCHFVNCIGSAAFFGQYGSGQSEDVFFIRNYVEKGATYVAGNGFKALLVDGYTAIDNVFDGISRPIDLELPSSGTCRMVNVRGNRIYNGAVASDLSATQTYNGIHLATETSSIIEGGYIAGNHFYGNTGVADILLAGDGGAIEGVAVIGNYSEGFSNTLSGQSNIQVRGCNGCVIQGNMGFNATATGTLWGIELENTDNSSVMGNVFKQSEGWTAGVRENTNCNDNQIVGNAVDAISGTATTTGSNYIDTKVAGELEMEATDIELMSSTVRIGSASTIDIISLLAGSADWVNPNIADGATDFVNVTVTGAVKGDLAIVHVADPDDVDDGIFFQAETTAADTVRVHAINHSGGAWAAAATVTIKAVVIRYS